MLPVFVCISSAHSLLYSSICAGIVWSSTASYNEIVVLLSALAFVMQFNFSDTTGRIMSMYQRGIYMDLLHTRECTNNRYCTDLNRHMTFAWSLLNQHGLFASGTGIWMSYRFRSPWIPLFIPFWLVTHGFRSQSVEIPKLVFSGSPQGHLPKSWEKVRFSKDCMIFQWDPHELMILYMYLKKIIKAVISTEKLCFVYMSMILSMVFIWYPYQIVEFPSFFHFLQTQGLQLTLV